MNLAIMNLTYILFGIVDYVSNHPTKFAGAIMIIIGMFLAVLSVGARTRVGGAFTHGKGPTMPINLAGRLIILAAAVALIIAGVQGCRQ